MRIRGSERGCVVALAFAASACAPLATRATTAPAQKGHFQGSLGGDAVLFRDTEQQVTTPGAMIDLGARYGLTDDLDVGLRLFNIGVEAGVKWRLFDGRLAGAVAPAAALVRTPESSVLTKATYVYGDLPFILGSRVSETLTFDYGARAFYGMYRPETGGTTHGLLAGVFTNLDVRMGKGFHLVPEIDLFGTVTGDVPVHGWIATGGTGLLKDF